MSFQENIQLWVSLDNKLKKINEQGRTIRQEKNELSENILSYVKSNNLENATIKISDGKLRFGTTKLSTPLTYKYVQECLSDYIKDEEKVEEIITYMKNKREIKESEEIKRVYAT